MISQKVLQQGTYFVEASFAGIIDKPALLNGLSTIGFYNIVAAEPIIRTTEAGLVTSFIADRAGSKTLYSTEKLRWHTLHRLNVKTKEPLTIETPLLQVERDERYEARFFGRMRQAPNVETVWGILTTMGFRVEKVGLLQKEAFLASRPGIGHMEWFAIGRWLKGSSYFSDKDTFFFEELIPLFDNDEPKPKAHPALTETTSSASVG